MSLLIEESAEVVADVNRAFFEVIDDEPAQQVAESRRSRVWCDYYRMNRTRLISIPWQRGVDLTVEERTVLIPSIQEFQLGESSDGANPKRLARLYAEATGDTHYQEAMNRFISEEHRHSRYLGRFLDLAGAPRLQSSWTDSIFRRLRRALGLELMLVTLLTAELISKVYYRALYSASSSELLRRICAQLLRDERKHVEFHVERLLMIRRCRSGWRRALTIAGQRVLFAGACLAVWRRHGAAIRMGGYGFRRFWGCAWAEFEKAIR